MGLYLVLLLAFAPLIANETEGLKNRILYVAKSGGIEEAICLYRKYHELTGEHDFEMLNHICLMIIDMGGRSADPEEKLLAYFGSRISLNEKTVPILEAGLLSDVPQLQMVCLNILAELDTDQANASIRALMRNPNPIIQLETTYCMAKRRSPLALTHAEAMLNKFPCELRFIFPVIFSEIDSPRANNIVRQLLSDRDEKVRLESILSVTEKGRDDFLPQIRRLAKQTSILQQEACAVSLGVFKDETSLNRLEQLAASPSPHVTVAAAHSLYKLGKKEYADLLAQGAKAEFPFAISALGDVPEAKDLLASLTLSPSPEVRLNAAIALLLQHDPRTTPALTDILLQKGGKLIAKGLSPAKSMTAFRYVNYHALKPEAGIMVAEMSRGIRSLLLQEALNLPQQDFLGIAKAILSTHQNDLVPTLVSLLENLGTEPAVNLLKEYQQKVGDPFVRGYCNLALYRMGEEGPYRDNLVQFIRDQSQVEIIGFRPFVPQEARLDIPSYELNPKETSQIYVETLEALTRAQGEHDVMTLLDAIETGNKKNRFALAGLLMRAMQ